MLPQTAAGNGRFPVPGANAVPGLWRKDPDCGGHSPFFGVLAYIV